MLTLVSVGFISVHLSGLIGAIFLLTLPLIFYAADLLIKKPKKAVWLVLSLSFLSPGLTRYIPGPWGLSIDILLALSWLSIILNKQIKVKGKHAKNPIIWVSLIWMGYLSFEMVNPAGNGPVAWFYGASAFIRLWQFPLYFSSSEKRLISRSSSIC